ncbi:hypothetical protein F5Y07DRAFT_374885 [Xylaria sp. FL0933]|nr:hypothetical protein F5Y07DRAFT_374885 [Xylaria sp. FL0933]
MLKYSLDFCVLHTYFYFLSTCAAVGTSTWAPLEGRSTVRNCMFMSVIHVEGADISSHMEIRMNKIRKLGQFSKGT